MGDISIQHLSSDPKTIEDLSDLLIETVNNGGSVSFMAPMNRKDAVEFWTRSLASADNGQRVVLGAMDGGRIIATVTLLLDFPPNQPHRCEIAKMITSLSHRGRGIAKILLQNAEQIAQNNGRWLVCLDTAVDGGAAGLYEKLGYERTGVIPDFALKPYGELTGTIIFYKRLSTANQK